MSDAMMPILTAYDDEGNEYPILGFQGPPYKLTDADKADIVQSVIAAIGVPVFGTVGEDKTITLSEELPEGVYTVRYATDDGYANIGTITVGNVAPDEPDEPQEPTAPDTTLVLIAGLKIDSSTGALTESTTGYSASEPIAIVDGYTYTIHKKSNISEGLKVCYYNADGTFISTSGDVIGATAEQTSAVIPLIDGAAFFRLRIYGTASLLDETTWELVAEKVTQ